MATNENPTKRLNAYDTLRQRYGPFMPAIGCSIVWLVQLFFFRDELTDATDPFTQPMWFYIGIFFYIMGACVKEQHDRIQKQIQALGASVAELKEKPAE